MSSESFEGLNRTTFTGSPAHIVASLAGPWASLATFHRAPENARGTNSRPPTHLTTDPIANQLVIRDHDPTIRNLADKALVETEWLDPESSGEPPYKQYLCS